MDPELKSVLRRYSVVGVVIAAATLWTVYYVVDRDHQNGAPEVMPPNVGPETARPVEPRPPPEAPALDAMFLEVNGARRVRCTAACRLEVYCSLRTQDACMKFSCDGDARIINRSDFAFAVAHDCGEAAVTPCEEACWRRGECSGDHRGDAQCTASCKTLTQQKPGEMYRESRCILEMPKCSDLATCGGVGG